VSVDVLRWEGLLEGEELAYLGTEPERVEVETARAFRVARGNGDEIEFGDHGGRLARIAD